MLLDPLPLDMDVEDLCTLLQMGSRQQKEARDKIYPKTLSQ
jgi:hypothetical protein